MIRTLKVLGVLGAALAGVGCTGAIDSSGSPGGGGKPPGNVTDPSNPGIVDPKNPTNPGLMQPSGNVSAGQLDDNATVPGTAPLRRLTVFEYRNTVRNLLGLKAEEVPTKELSLDIDSGLSGYLRGSALSTATDARALGGVADGVAAIAQSKLGSLLPCSPIPSGASEQDACVNDFIAKFGLRAFRRPVAKTEADRLVALYKSLRTGDAGASFERAMGLMVSAILQAPQFIYHWELGPNAPLKDGNLVRFNSYEVASRLSYMLWGTMPDDKLFEAAAGGRLVSPEQIATEAKRLMDDARADEALADFHFQWLEMTGLDNRPKNPEAFKDYNAELVRAMEAETTAFVNGIFKGSNATGKLETLLTSNQSFINDKLGKLYGVTMAGADLKAATLNPQQRAGILTQGHFLAAKGDADDSHPVWRGDTILKRLLCTELTPPPGELIPPVADPTPDKTTRQRFTDHTANPTCAACHKYINPLGFAFENYDAIGTYREMENTQKVNAASTFELESIKFSFNNAIDLVKALAKEPKVQECMVEQWLRYGLRRKETMGEKPSLAALGQTFSSKGYDMRELIVAITKTRAFTHRTLSEGEVAQ